MGSLSSPQAEGEYGRSATFVAPEPEFPLLHYIENSISILRPRNATERLLERYTEMMNESVSEVGDHIRPVGTSDGPSCVTLSYSFAFLRNDEESYAEASDLFIHSWPNNAKAIYSLNKQIFGTDTDRYMTRDNIAVVSVGNSSTQAYHYVDADPSGARAIFLEPRLAFSGVDNLPSSIAEQVSLIGDIFRRVLEVAPNKNILFVNAIGFGVPKGQDFQLITSVKVAETTDRSASYIQRLASALALHDVQNKQVLVVSPDLKPKLRNKWTDVISFASVDGLIHPENPYFIADYGGGKINVAMFQGTKQVSTDPVVKVQYEQNPIIDEFMRATDIPAESSIPAKLVELKQTMSDGIVKYMAANNLDLPIAQVFVYQTGKLRQLQSLIVERKAIDSTKMDEIQANMACEESKIESNEEDQVKEVPVLVEEEEEIVPAGTVEVDLQLIPRVKKAPSKGRNAPEEPSGNLGTGEIRKGLDGADWVVAIRKNRVKYWKRI